MFSGIVPPYVQWHSSTICSVTEHMVELCHWTYGGTMPLNIWWSYVTEHMVELCHWTYGGIMPLNIWWSYATEHMVELCHWTYGGTMTLNIWWSYATEHMEGLCHWTYGGAMPYGGEQKICWTKNTGTIITMKLPPSPRIIWSFPLLSYSSIKSSACFLLKHICWSRYSGSSPHHKLHSSGYNCCWGPIGMHRCTAWPTTPLHSTSNNLYIENKLFILKN